MRGEVVDSLLPVWEMAASRNGVHGSRGKARVMRTPREIVGKVENATVGEVAREKYLDIVRSARVRWYRT